MILAGLIILSPHNISAFSRVYDPLYGSWWSANQKLLFDGCCIITDLWPQEAGNRKQEAAGLWRMRHMYPRISQDSLSPGGKKTFAKDEFWMQILQNSRWNVKLQGIWKTLYLHEFICSIRNKEQTERFILMEQLMGGDKWINDMFHILYLYFYPFHLKQ